MKRALILLTLLLMLSTVQSKTRCGSVLPQKSEIILGPSQYRERSSRCKPYWLSTRPSITDCMLDGTLEKKSKPVIAST